MTIANVEMAKAWDGEEGDRWVEHADRYEATALGHWQRLLDRQPVTTSDRVLDIGCGTGSTTRDAARIASSGSALGVDLSARMLELARRRTDAEGLTNVDFEQADAQVHPFDAAAFDVAVSRFGAMFFNDPVAAFRNIGGALRPEGRLAVLAWRELARNEWVLMFREVLAAGRQLPEPPKDAPGPFGLADADRVRKVLTAAGFEEIDLDSIDEPIVLGTDADDAYSFVRTMGIVRGLTEDLDDDTTAAALDRLHAALVAHETDEGVRFGTSAWLITARRR